MDLPVSRNLALINGKPMMIHVYEGWRYGISQVISHR